MRILGIETSGWIGGAALAVEGRVRVSRRFRRGMIHGRELVPAIDAILKKARIRPDRLDGIAVSRGPGSYTGLRVGVTVAKMMAHTLGIPLVGVPTPEALVANAPKGRARILGPVLDAKWDQVYVALFREDADGVRTLIDGPRAVAPAELARQVEPGTLLFGDGMIRFAAAFAGASIVVGPEAWGIPKAGTVALIGGRMLAEGKRDEPTALAPVYLRSTEGMTKKKATP